MREEEIVEFVKKYIEPLPAYPPYGERFRVSASLIDGTQLPCVVIEGATKTVDLAIKRFEETKKSADPYTGYRAIIRSFVTTGGTVDSYNLKELSISPFAIPLNRMREINGETCMGWTAFSAVMKDGQQFHFGTTYLTEFFSMPNGYIATDIEKITPAIRGQRPTSIEGIYREKPFFICYVDGL